MSILDNVAEAKQHIAPQDITEFIALQMALKAGDPHLFRPYLHFIESSSLGHALAIFRSEQRLPINN